MSLVSAQNVEEASTIAADFIYSIDNLPQEVAHLLQEIKFRELKTQELQQEIDKDSARYIRHALRASSTSSTPTTDPASREPSPKSTLLPGKIASSYAHIQLLAAEKCALSQRIIDIVARTKSRLDHELIKIRVLQGETADGGVPVSGLGLGLGLGVGLGTGSAADALASGRDPAMKITESLRNVLAGSAVGVGHPGVAALSAAASPAASGGGGSSGGSANKKRRITTTTPKPVPSPTKASSTKRRSSSPAVVPLTHTSTTVHARSRLSRQIHPPQPQEPEDADMDAEGEEDADAEGEADADEDERLYCFCQKHSYGDMIACDNDGCPYEWFHLSCVGMKQPLPDKWYCSACTSKGAGQPTGRKGRKK